MPGATRGHHHAGYRFTLVMHPEKFAAARDEARTAPQERVNRALRDLQPERIALQRQREDFGGTLTEAEYNVKLADLERATRRKAPVPQASRSSRPFGLGTATKRRPARDDKTRER
jgi:hypothetical protein